MGAWKESVRLRGSETRLARQACGCCRMTANRWQKGSLVVWGDGSVGKELAMQTQGPEFSPQKLHLKTGYSGVCL